MRRSRGHQVTAPTVRSAQHPRRPSSPAPPPLRVLMVMMMLAATAGTGHAAKLLVTNNGVDSGTCGAKKDPCRSMTQAITNAADGDKIEVGAGRYGDLDGDGVNDPGDEDAEVDSGCDCMIHVDKRVTLTSVDGAGATVLDAGGRDIDVVCISASNVRFGKKKKGFTLTGAGGAEEGMFIASGTSGIRVEGNRASANGAQGFEVDNPSSGHRFVANASTDNGNDGFFVDGDRHTFIGNLSSRNADDGFFLGGPDYTVKGNVASSNHSHGFLASDTGHTLTRNVASGNGDTGFAIIGDGIEVTRNAALGNMDEGIRVSGTVALLAKNTVFGNDEPSGNNCGIRNTTAVAVVAEKNFWGAATGPGGNPADAACADPGVIDVDPFASKPFKVPAGAGK